MSEETRIILVNSVSPSEYITITNDFRKLEKEIENLEKLNNANYQSFIETNKIIIELEKYIKESCWKDDWGVESIYVKRLLNKLQELKGDGK